MTSPSRSPATEPVNRPSQLQSSPTRAAWYRREPWLALMSVAFVPALGSLVVPETLRNVLLGVTAVLAVVGLVVLVAQHRRDGARQPEYPAAAEESADRAP